MKEIDKKIIEMCAIGLSDQEIGAALGYTGEGIAYRRKLLGILRSDKNTIYRSVKSKFMETSKCILEEDYYACTTKDFSKKYGLSKTVWLPHLRSLGIIDKQTHRIIDYPSFTEDQKKMLIGSMLGDGSISEGRYSEFHSFKQETYLRKKHDILKPFSCSITPENDGAGLRFSTVNHPQFEKFESFFYRSGINGKLIPIDFIKDNWGDSILAYWYFDDGHLDDKTGEYTISNKCPLKDQLQDLVNFLQEKYGWEFYVSFNPSIYRVSFSKKYNKAFGDLLLKYATPDLYYKISEECLGVVQVNKLNITNIKDVKPKFYRIAEPLLKTKMEEVVFNYYKEKGFPYMQITEDRLNYLYDTYTKISVECVNSTIQHNTSGVQLCEYFFPNIYECKRKGFSKSPVEYWNDDAFLRKFVKNRLTYADIISDASMRTGIKLSKICVSNFKPSVAHYLYSKYAANSNILDYSSGFGSRMLAAMSLGLNYVGYEPSKKTYYNLNKFGNFLSSKCTGSYHIINGGSENSVFRENYFGFAFSSPPYYDFETYSEDSDQSILKYPTYDLWMLEFWRRVMENCYKSLVNDGYFGVCLSPSIASDLITKTIEYAKEIGFYFKENYRVLFKHVLGGGNKVELVLIFSKKPSNKEFKFLNNYEEKCTHDNVFYTLKERSKRVFYTEEDYKNAEKQFKKLYLTNGVSRNTYYNTELLGVPVHCIEKKYNGWNNFIVYCGISPSYEAKSPKERVQEYFNTCLSEKMVLSFYEYEKISGFPSTRMKRLFNAGKPYAHLKTELFEVAINVDRHTEFLKKLER